MPSTGFIKPISVTTTGTVENEDALLGIGDAKLTGNGAFVNAIYPSFDIPSNATITGITFKTRITPISISTLAIFEARLQIDAIGGSVTLSDSSTSLQQIFLTQGNVTVTLGQAIDIEHTFNSSNSTVNTVDEDNDIIQQLIPDGTQAPFSQIKAIIGLIDPSDPVADIVQINCGTESPVINIEYSLPPPAKVKITNSTKVLLKNVIGDSNQRGATTLVDSDGVQSANSLLLGTTSNASMQPSGFVILSDFFTSSNPEGEFTIPENASNIQVTTETFGQNVLEGNVRLKYTFISSGNEDVTIVGDNGINQLPLFLGIRSHTDTFTHSDFTPSFWNNFTQVKIELNDDYPFNTNYVILGNSDNNDPSLQLTFGPPPSAKVIIK